MPITVTESALKELNRIKDEQKLPVEAGIRLGVRGGGCSGFNYSLGFETNQAEGDHVFDEQGLAIFCDPKSFLYLNGTQIDFEDGLMGRGFKFNNPNASGSCGCGESFSC